MNLLKNEKTSNWATIISGQPRAKLVEPKEEYEAFVSGLENKPDIFSHIWDCGRLLSSWGPRGWLGAAGKEGTTVTFSSKEALDVWKPHAYVMEDYDNLPFKDLTTDYNIQQGCSQWYGINTAYSAMESFENVVSEKYDFVMRYRYDLEFAPHNQHNQRDWKLIEEMLTDDPNLIIGDSGSSYEGFGDLIAFGSRNAMVKYSEFYKHWENIRPGHGNNEMATEYYLKEMCGLNLIAPWAMDIGMHR
tara:strand:- start:455 stop:1192 length:738 start_codon:yes stop_codon:yes gene_type:complete